ncbi:methyltransferase domain-containing protein [Vibrio sp. 03-59-1]|uniref:class I SAM-dependent DNA methyltransferase n=1 Tax=Vibrio sp. 03-59-1 TaxID=2607607 RepID=UPI001493418C|nr:class I SAM-dependent methyltransferase [Vibrio sp. 03-59-1]NOH82766.1 methyltransferase domain-containing protein [Vibrio sp. 03-59-1]
MANEWDEYAVNWEKDQATGQFSQSVFNELEKLINLEDVRVLDFGCGTGLLSQKLSPLVKDIVAIDGSEAMVEELDKKELPNVEPVVDLLSRGLAAQHPAFRRQFDLVVASSVCGFLPNFQDSVSLIYTLLEDDGLFVHWDWLVEDENVNYGLSVQKIENVLSAAGFDDVQVSVPFEIDAGKGAQKVVMGVGRRGAFQ